MAVMPRILILTTLSLLVLATPARAEKLTGYAEYRDGKYLIVDGQRVWANKRTVVDGRGKAKRFSTIPLGHDVEVKGERQRDGTIYAQRIVTYRNRDTSKEKDLKKAFDKMERSYRKQGRMKTVNEDGKVVEDYGDLLQEGPQVDRVRKIASKLSPSYIDPDSMRIYVVDNDEWNAMAAPNYSIYVFSGLLDDMDDDEVAIVLGHELAHASHEHSRRQSKRGIWVSVGALAIGAAGQAIDNDTAKKATQLSAMLGASALMSGYSRDHEDQADRVGMRYAHEAGYDVTKGPALWKKFSDKYGETNKAVNFFFGDHSRSSKRAGLLRQEIARNNYDG